MKEQYIIITDVSVTTPGDERSRTHPGHGYPESTDTYQRVQFFENKEEWQERVAVLQRQRYGNNPFKAGKFISAEVTTTIEVKV